MKRFIEGQDRSQVTLLPECLDDYIGEDNPVRVVDAFVAELDLEALGFEGATAAATGRPSYHPSVLLKVYVYGYLNRIQSSRRLEHECQRNVELMWLTGRLAPDFKTIADFRHDNGAGIRNVCRRFVVLCRQLKLFSQAAVAVDSSKFKAVNSRDRNFTPAKIEKRKQQIEESVQRYLSALDTADRTMPLLEFGPRFAHLKDKLSALRKQMRRMDEMKERLKAEPDEQLSLTDPDARSMMSQAKGTGLVGYNVQTAVDAKHHLIVAHEVTNKGHDRAQLSKMALAAREAMGKQKLQAYADRGYFSGLEIKACDEAGIKAFVPKPMTSNAKAEGRFSKADFIYIKRDDEYQCPAGRTRDPPVQLRGRRPDDANLLEQRLPWLRHQSAVHDLSVSTHPQVGARGGAGADAAPARPQARGDDATTKHRRARLRNAQALDGDDALPDSKARAREHRDEPARAGLQPQASDASARHCQNDEGDEFGGRVSAFLCPNARISGIGSLQTST